MVDFPEYYEQMQGSLRAPPPAPTQTAPSQPATPPRQLTPAELRALYLDPNRSDPPVAGPPRPPAPRPAVANPQTVTPELVEDLQQFQTDYRNQLTGAQPPQLSVLDMLRKRMATSMQDEQANRTADFGRALLASRSPNFFTALGEGLAAQEAGATSRMDRLRQLADTERQQQELETRQAAQRAEEDYRRQTIGLRERELAAGRRPNIITMIDPETRNAVLVNAETGQVVSRTPFRPMQELRNAPRPLSQAQIANIRQQVTRLASTDAGIVENVTPTPAQIARRDELANQYFRDRLDAAAAGLLDFQGGGAGTATTGGAGAPAGTQPSQTLTYPRTP